MDRKFNLELYKTAKDNMIAKNGSVYQDWYNRRRSVTKTKEYTLEEVEKIINSGCIEEQKLLSRNYFYKDGFYKRIILYYASLLKYTGILIPEVNPNRKLEDSYILKRYNLALTFVDKMKLPTFLTNCSIKALVDGTYYGIIQKLDKNSFVVLDLPSDYCRSRFKDVNGNDIIEFNLSYFDSIIDEEHRQAALNNFPEDIANAYEKWVNRKGSRWVFISTGVSVCFSFLEDGIPPFLSIIPSTIQYDTAVETDQRRDADEIKKILVQKIPHLQDGELLFEPDEAEEMHAAAVGMLKHNENLSVLTTYNDIEAILSKTSAETANSTLERMLQNIYSNTGASSQVFSSTGSSTLETSINNDISYMMILGNKYSVFITNIVNLLCGNGNVSFKYTILPISYYNQQKYLDLTHKLANSGYSFLLPSIALDLNQKDIVNIKYLENKILKLDELLIPLSSAFTQKAEANKTGRPKLDDSEKAKKTLQNEESLDNQT